MGEVSWSTTLVEQGHGSVAVIHKVHPEYSPATLAARGMVHMMRSLPPAEVDPETASASTQRAIRSLQRKRPHKLSGRHVFLRECIAAAGSSSTRCEAVDEKQARTVMRNHSAMFNASGEDDKQLCEAKARHESFEKAPIIDQELLAIAEQEGPRKRRRLEAEREASQSFRISACRFADDDLGAMAELWTSGAYLDGKARGLKASAMATPAAPSPEVQAQLESTEAALPDHESAVIPPWCSIVAKHRDVFASCIFVFVYDKRENYYLFLYATQSPYAATFVALTLLDSPLPASDPNSWTTWLGSPLRRPDFEFLIGRKYFREVGIPCPEGTEMFVIPKAFFSDSGHVATYAEPLAFGSFVQGLPAPPPKSHSSERKARTNDLDKLVAEFPWLQNYVSQGSGGKHKGGPAKKTTPTGEPQKGEETTLTEGEIDALFERLEMRRREWSQVYAGARHEFDTTLLGGAWTLRHRNVDMDAAKGYARGKRVQQWCSEHGLYQQASFSFDKYGEAVAVAMPEYWADRMQCLYSMSGAHDKKTRQFSECDYASLPRADRVRELCQGLPHNHPVWARLAELEASAL